MITKLVALISAILIIVFIWGDKYMWEDDAYAVYYIDGNINLGIKVDDEGSFHSRVDNEVIAVGSNENYVVAMRLMDDSDSISYFFIDKQKDNIYLNPLQITKGPYTELEFNQLSEKLNLPEFSKAF